MLLCEGLLHLLPGDATTMPLLAAQESISPAGAARLRSAWGQDLSLPQRLAERFSDLLSGHLGTSVIDGRPVADALARALATSAPLMLLSLLLGLPGGFALGMWTAGGGSRARRMAHAATALWLATPVFALVVVHLRVAEHLGLPLAGTGSLGWSPDAPTWQVWLDHLHHMLLPLWVLSSLHGALTARYTHGLARQARHAPPVRLASARGLPSALVRRRYVAPLVLTRLAPLLSARMATVVASNLVVEILFVWPGVGHLIWTAMKRRDAPLVTGGLILVGTTVYVANRLADATSTSLDPMRRGRQAA